MDIYEIRLEALKLAIERPQDYTGNITKYLLESAQVISDFIIDGKIEAQEVPKSQPFHASLTINGLRKIDMQAAAIEKVRDILKHTPNTCRTMDDMREVVNKSYEALTETQRAILNLDKEQEVPRLRPTPIPAEAVKLGEGNNNELDEIAMASSKDRMIEDIMDILDDALYNYDDIENTKAHIRIARKKLNELHPLTEGDIQNIMRNEHLSPSQISYAILHGMRYRKSAKKMIKL